VKITRSREHTINMGSYESLKVGASVELNFQPGSLEDDKVVHDAADNYLARALEADLNEAIDLLPAGSSSYILSWRQNA
jgi:hypothetical protein